MLGDVTPIANTRIPLAFEESCRILHLPKLLSKSLSEKHQNE